jgi:hypothetical protein
MVSSTHCRTATGVHKGHRHSAWAKKKAEETLYHGRRRNDKASTYRKGARVGLSRVRVERRVDADRQPPAYLPKTQLRLCRLSPTRQQLQCHPRQLHRPRALFPAQLKSCLKPVCVCPLFSLFFGGLAKKAMLPTLPRFTALVCSHSRDRVAAV